MNPFDYNFKPTPEMIEAMQSVRAQFKTLADTIISVTPAGRERALVLTNLEQAAMWANKAISHETEEAR